MASKLNKKSMVLTSQELIEFQMRLATFNQARSQLVMVQEAYVAWTKEIAKKYRLPHQFDVNTQTGEINIRPKSDNVISLDGKVPNA